jgi:hypothetical protein
MGANVLANRSATTSETQRAVIVISVIATLM